MDVLFLILFFVMLFFVMPLFMAFKLCGWQVVVSFLIAIFIIPFCVVFLSVLTLPPPEHMEFSFKDGLAITAMFALPGIPIHFFIILPLYYFIQKLKVNFFIAFPCVVALIMLVILKLLEKEPQPFLAYLIVIGCGVAHSLLITWLIIKFKAISA